MLIELGMVLRVEPPKPRPNRPVREGHILCTCGSWVTAAYYRAHLLTKRHQEFLGYEEAFEQ